MGRKKKDKSIELISKTIIEPGTDKEFVEEKEIDKKEENQEIEISTVSVGNLNDLPIAKGMVKVNGSGLPYTNQTDVNNFLQTIYDLGYSDGKIGKNKRELRIDKETGRLKF